MNHRGDSFKVCEMELALDKKRDGHDDSLVSRSVEIKCFNGNVNSLDKDRLNGTPVCPPKLDWKIHRLLWIGYNKNCDNEECLIATLSKDIIFLILEFFFVYKPKFINMKFDAEKTLNHVVKKYFEYLHEHEKYMYNELLSLKPCEMKHINKIKLGERIMLATGKTAVVKYIGTSNFVNKDEKVIGLELDTWDANACDGTVLGKRIFRSSPGRAYFIQCNSYTNIVPFNLREGSYARFQGLERVCQFNGKTVKLVSWVSKKKRWKVKLLQNKKERKYLGVRPKNLKPLVDWEDDRNINVESSLTRLPKIGDRVKMRNNSWGVVKYVGTTRFSRDTQIIGLELDRWSPNAHDGKVKGSRYFTSQQGRGYFVKLEQLIENVGIIDWPTGMMFLVFAINYIFEHF